MRIYSDIMSPWVSIPVVAHKLGLELFGLRTITQLRDHCSMLFQIYDLSWEYSRPLQVLFI